MKVSEVLGKLTGSGNNVEAVLGVAKVVLKNMIYSNLEWGKGSELNCLLDDFSAILESNVPEPTNTLRMKAVCERGERFCNQFTQGIIDVFQNNVIKLGSRLSIDEHSLSVFSESFVRFHLVFQFSKCVDYLST